MYTSTALLDFHERAHRSLVALLRHCREFDQAELDRELTGFGYPTVQLQFHHAIAAERYWVGVLEGRMDVDEDARSYPTIAALGSLRERVFEVTERHLRASSDEALNAGRAMVTWNNQEQVLIPAQVIIRTQTHLYHHQGQIAAMCRLLDRPSPGSDYPIR